MPWVIFLSFGVVTLTVVVAAAPCIGGSRRVWRYILLSLQSGELPEGPAGRNECGLDLWKQGLRMNLEGAVFGLSAEFIKS